MIKGSFNAKQCGDCGSEAYIIWNDDEGILVECPVSDCEKSNDFIPITEWE